MRSHRPQAMGRRDCSHNSVTVSPSEIHRCRPACCPPFQTGQGVAQAIRSGRPDCEIETLSVARTAGLDFLPIVWERFDLVFRQRDYFRHGPQALLKFMHSPTFRVRAKEFGGYDVEFAGEVRGVQ